MTCKYCQLAKWELTPAGRIKRNIAGVCTVPVPELALPLCITVQFSRSGIWPDYGKGCVTFQPKEEGVAPLPEKITKIKTASSQPTT